MPAAIGTPIVVQRRARNFVRHYWKLFRFALSHIGARRLIQVTVLDITAAAAQGGIIFLAAAFASFMEHGGAQLQEYGLSFIADDTLTALIAFSVPILVLLLYASFAGFLAAKCMREYGRLTQIQLSQALLSKIQLLDRLDWSGIVPTPGRFKLLLGRDLRQSGMSVAKMLRLIQPAIYIVLALATIVYLEPLLSVAVLAALAVMFPVFYLMGRRIQKNALNFYGAQKAEAAQAVALLTDQIQGSNVGQSSRVRRNWLASNPAYAAFLDTYDRHKLASDRMALRASLLRSIFLVCGLVAFGWIAIEGQRSWSVLVVYLGALLFLASGLQKFLGILTALVKYYPQTQTLASMIDRLEAAETSLPGSPELPAELDFAIRPKLEDSERTRTMARGETAAVLSKTPLRRLSFQELLRPLRRASGKASDVWDTAGFLASVHPLAHGTVARSVLGEEASESKRAWLDGFLSRATESSYRKALPDGIETELTMEKWEALHPRVRAALALASACAETRGALFLCAEIASHLPADLLQDLPRTENIHFLFVVSSDVDLRLRADHYIVSDERSVIGLGNHSWVEAHEETIAPLISRKKDGETDIDDEDDD